MCSSDLDIPEEKRRDFYLYIDEFQNFSTESFANILSEARKYRLNLIMAHQYIEQLDERVKPAVFGNVGTIIVFRVGAADAEELVKEFTPVFTEEDIVNLPKYEMYLKLMIDGIASDPFSAVGLLPLSEEEKTNNTDKVISYSRQKYATRKDIVEEKIVRWHQDDKEGEKSAPPKVIKAEVSPMTSAGERRDKKMADSGFISACSSCGVIVNTPFKPDGVRPVYCKKCLSNKPAERRGQTTSKIIDNKPKKQEKPEIIRPIKKEEIKSDVLSITLEELKKKQPISFYQQKNKIDNSEKGRSIPEKNIVEGEDVIIES